MEILIVDRNEITNLIERSNKGERRNVKSPLPLKQHEKEAVYYLFAKFQLLDPIAFKTAMPNLNIERIVKNEFSNLIRGFTKTQIDYGFGELKKLIGMNNPDYKYLTVAKVVGFVANGGNSEPPRAGMYAIEPPVIKPANSIGSTIDAMRASAVDVLNPTTGEYGIALATKGKRLGLNDKAQAEETLKKLNSLFD